jgi:formiminotetrahydrofolate cyclodeaminase
LLERSSARIILPKSPTCQTAVHGGAQRTTARIDLRRCVTEIIYRLQLPWYSRRMKDFGIWFRDLSSKPLPGSVAAAAVSAAMGAALIAKSTRITLQRQGMDSATRGALQALWELADRQQAVLIDLADADERAYRAVLEAGSLPESSSARAAAWLQATDTPIRLAETCHALVESARPLLNTCWPAVCPDPEIGVWLLETGLRAGLAAAEGNIGSCADTPETHALQRRIDLLK